MEELREFDKPQEAAHALFRLAAGWAGRREYPVTEAAIVAALTIAFRLGDSHHRLPQIYPLADGGLQREGHVFGADVEFEVDRSGAPFGTAPDAAGRTLWERKFGVEDISVLADPGRLAAKMAQDLESSHRFQ